MRQVYDQRDFAKAETWLVADKKSDREGIALWARNELLGAECPSSAVQLATAWTEGGAYHAAF